MRPTHVTVVVPALNAAQWIGATLETVVGQTCPKDCLDVVVVDDGSDDETAAVATRVLAGSGIALTILRHETPQGPSAARNRGWRHSRGEWVQFLDADDLLEPSKIERQVEATLSALPEVAAVYSPWGRLVEVGGEWLPHTRSVEPVVGEDPLLDVLSADNFIQLSSALFARSWLERTGGFNESYRLIEDVDLLMRIVMQGGTLQGHRSAAPLSWYRQRPGSLSRSNDRAFVDGCVRNARAAEAYWRSRQAITPERASLLAGVYFMGARYYAEHDSAAFDDLTATIFRLQPTFLPDAPNSLRLLSRAIGYVRAERLAVVYRRIKRAITRPWAPAPALRAIPARGPRS